MAGERIQRRIERLLDEADEAFAERNWPVVRDNAQDVLRLDSENQDALTFLSAAEQALVRDMRCQRCGYIIHWDVAGGYRHDHLEQDKRHRAKFMSFKADSLISAQSERAGLISWRFAGTQGQRTSFRPQLGL